MKTLNMTIQEKRELLDFFLKKGQVGSVEFIKADNTITKRNIRLWQEDGLSSGDRNDVQPNSTAHKPDIYTYYDNAASAYRKLNLHKLLSAVLGGKHYIFDI